MVRGDDGVRHPQTRLEREPFKQDETQSLVKHVINVTMDILVFSLFMGSRLICVESSEMPTQEIVRGAPRLGIQIHPKQTNISFYLWDD